MSVGALQVDLPIVKTSDMIDLCCRELGHYDLVKVSNTLMFIFTEKDIFVSTPLQLFMIKHGHGKYIKRLNDLRGTVESGQIKTISDLVTYNGLKPGGNSQMLGLELIRMDISWVR